MKNKYTIWYSTKDFANFIIDNTKLKDENITKKYLPESDAGKPKLFHSLPTHIKKIQYLDSPDLIIELNGEPILSIEYSTEAGTGHNAFQRFSRIVAAVENNVPCIYIYPKAVFITRKDSKRWDKINPLIFRALEKLRDLYPEAPAILYYYPTYFHKNNTNFNRADNNRGLDTDIKKHIGAPNKNKDMNNMFKCIDDIIKHKSNNYKYNISTLTSIQNQRDNMIIEYGKRLGNRNKNKLSPLTSVITVPTSAVRDFIIRTNPNSKKDYFNNNYSIWNSRKYTKIYRINALYRGDPYPGALAAIDYLTTRIGPTNEDREFNLVLAWGNVTYNDGKLNIKPKFKQIKKGQEKITKGQGITDFINKVKKNNDKSNILSNDFKNIKFEQIPRYFMQLRFGSTFSKPKDIRIYSYFSDAILFYDGALWRDI